MKYFATYNANGEYTGFYPEELYKDGVTDTHIVLTKEQWQEALHQRCAVINGVHTLNPITQAEQDANALAAIRVTRDNLLVASDWTQMPDSPLTGAQKAAWVIYRNELRNFPNTVDLNNVVWPTPPTT